MNKITEKYTKNGIAKDIEEATQRVAKALNALDAARFVLKRIENRAPEWNMEVLDNVKEVSIELAYVLAALVTWWDDENEETEE